ncbi:hypothetical protein [Moraxella sp. VT-16-12]|uniref:hypothetical protein n=1 Tax=Moraxella sp. VT-16-12 TaxID=2014877 RepID=UPI000B7DD2A8|nr:hypothetical protein [Moraxella sp. VT-16-12]TWV81518.1 hypothetical protein CEW93_007320 [Moraxella sp. VT-16-12]
MKYKVLIQHFGDKQYWAGDVREIDNEQDARTLIDMGLIALPDESVEDEPKVKVKTPPKNKSEN